MSLLKIKNSKRCKYENRFWRNPWTNWKKNGAEKSTLMKTITGLEKQDLALIYYY